MKKFKLLVVLFIFASHYTNAQFIDIIGKGIKGELNSNLPTTEIYNIESVVVQAIYKSDGFPVKNGVYFYDQDEKKGSNYIPISKRTDIVNFYRTFYTSDNNGVFASIEIENVYSFFEFIYRNTLTSQYKSFSNLETGFVYHNGSKNPFVYKIPIDTSDNNRNIVVKIPITELSNDDRVAIIDITIGQTKKRFSVKTYNSGNSFFLGEYPFLNVPGNVDHVLVSIFSPTKNEAQEMGFKDGDSFIISGAIIDVDKQFNGCTFSKGYWKTHSQCFKNGDKRDNTWDYLKNAENTIFFLSNQNYCQVNDTNPGKGGKYYILAHQYIASQLNLYNNANPTDITNAFNEATKFLMTYSPADVDGNKNLEDKCVQLGDVLDRYNNGHIGPGHCDDSPILGANGENKIKNYNIYPNPTKLNGFIEFISNENSRTTVTMYSISGIKIAVLFEGETLKGQKTIFNFNSDKFKPGVYFINIKNGSSSKSKKIIISN
ncbi:MAG: T9SS type A sorting domain-containing protein [Flavobacteriaceae bacterium]|nr:T9SS type A sorting domain-containing protein [Flavobacteriaceae bacterium]